MSTADQNEDANETYGERIRSIQEAIADGSGVSMDARAFIDKMANQSGVSKTFPNTDPDAQSRYLEELLEKWKWGSNQTGRALIDAEQATTRGDMQGARRILETAKERIAMPFYVGILDAALRHLADGQSGSSG